MMVDQKLPLTKPQTPSFYDLSLRLGVLARLFLDGIAAYQSGDYDRAVEAFGRIADSGVENAKLYYNLANAYLKNNDLGVI